MTADGATPGTRDERVRDVDLHGVVGVRLVNAAPGEIRAVRRQLGPGTGRPLTRPPDLTVRFVHQLPMPGLRYVEPGRSGFTDDGFFLLSHRRRPVAARLPFDAGDGPWEIQCRHGAPVVPLLEDWVRLVALSRGYAPVHASAFLYRGTGVVVAGGPHGGKTSCLLAFAGTGATFVSDDLVLLGGEPPVMLGFDTDLSVADWQLDQLPAGPGRRIGTLRRSLLAGTRGLERLQSRLGSGGPASLLHIAVPALRRRLKVSLPPDAIFDAIFDAVHDRPAGPGAVFLAMSHAADAVSAEPADPHLVASRLAAGLQLQLHGFLEQYRAFRFAFPERRLALAERVTPRAEAILRRVLESASVHEIRHPHPVALKALRLAMEPLIPPPTVAATEAPPAQASMTPAAVPAEARGERS